MLAAPRVRHFFIIVRLPSYVKQPRGDGANSVSFPDGSCLIPKAIELSPVRLRQLRSVLNHKHVLGVTLVGAGRVVKRPGLDVFTVDHHKLAMHDGVTTVKAHRHALIYQIRHGGVVVAVGLFIGHHRHSRSVAVSTVATGLLVKL